MSSIQERSPKKSNQRQPVKGAPRKDEDASSDDDNSGDNEDDDDDDDDDDEEAEELAFKKYLGWKEADEDYLSVGEVPAGEDGSQSPVPDWVRCSPADLYFVKDGQTKLIEASKRMKDLESRFEKDLAKRADSIRETKEPYVKPERPNPALTKNHHHCHGHKDGGSSSGEDSNDSELEELEMVSEWMDELNRKKAHPERLHEELWFNEPDERNDGPLCRCSLKARQVGIRHDIYPGETPVSSCNPDTNNADKVFHYRISMSPPTNFLTKHPTIIEYDNHEYIFEGFSLFSHYKLINVPVCKVVRFHIEYTIHWFEEPMPENFTMRSLDLFNDYFFYELLELLDLDWKPKDGNSCSRFHLMPRFSRGLPDNGKEVLSMNEVLNYLLRSSEPLVLPSELDVLKTYTKAQWQDYVDKVRGMLVTLPSKRPAAIRIDQLDRDATEKEPYPTIIHFGMRPAQLSYAGDPNYQKLWKQYVKFNHLLANKPKVSLEDKRKQQLKEEKLQEMRFKSTLKREVTIELNSKGFIKTGIRSDVCQHAMLIPVLIGHLRFHKCLDTLEKTLKYKFRNRMLAQLALTHPSYKMNFGTNPDHARNSLSNCGIRQPEYGDRRIHHMKARKRGIHTLIHIMSRLGRKEETASEIYHYERLEFLGDAVVEFLSSIHLFHLFPTIEEGGLATYRSALVQNQHLAVLAKKLKLDEYMLYAHGPDLCFESGLRHAMANCLEALMGALFMDGGIELADRVFSEVLFDDDPELLDLWIHFPPHPLQEDEPHGDRHWIEQSPTLQQMVKFEELTGIPFNHIRLLARAFTMRNVKFNLLTFGHNQRLEWLGDTVLQLIASEYLFKHFPEHHEGHLSLLRSCLVNNRTQAVVCDDLGMTDYIIQAKPRADDQTMKHKERADLLEAYMGALYVDKDLDWCKVFCHVCFFPRLKHFILSQTWNDPKSQLQQCCLTLRDIEGEPDMPVYKVIASHGPTNTRRYVVAVYFRNERLATGTGHSIQQAEMDAASTALDTRANLFPQLVFQKKFIEKKYRKKWMKKKSKKDKLGDKSGSKSSKKNSKEASGSVKEETKTGVEKNSEVPEGQDEKSEQAKAKSTSVELRVEVSSSSPVPDTEAGNTDQIKCEDKPESSPGPTTLSLAAQLQEEIKNKANKEGDDGGDQVDPKSKSGAESKDKKGGESERGSGRSQGCLAARSSFEKSASRSFEGRSRTDDNRDRRDRRAFGEPSFRRSFEKSDRRSPNRRSPIRGQGSFDKQNAGTKNSNDLSKFGRDKQSPDLRNRERDCGSSDLRGRERDRRSPDIRSRERDRCSPDIRSRDRDHRSPDLRNRGRDVGSSDQRPSDRSRRMPMDPTWRRSFEKSGRSSPDMRSRRDDRSAGGSSWRSFEKSDRSPDTRSRARDDRSPVERTWSRSFENRSADPRTVGPESQSGPEWWHSGGRQDSARPARQDPHCHPGEGDGQWGMSRRSPGMHPEGHEHTERRLDPGLRLGAGDDRQRWTGNNSLRPPSEMQYGSPAGRTSPRSKFFPPDERGPGDQQNIHGSEPYQERDSRQFYTDYYKH